MSDESPLKNQFINANVLIPENVSFRGSPKKGDGTTLTHDDLRFLGGVILPVVQATQKIMLPKPDKFNIDAPFVSPRTVIVFNGLPNAASRIIGPGVVEVNVGMLFAFISLKYTVELIFSYLRSNIHPLAILKQFSPPPEAVNEIGNLMDAWSRSAETGWKEMYLPRPTTMFSWDIYSGMVYIVVGHELTHWFETIYKKAEWTRMMKETDDHIRTWLKEEEILDTQIVEIAERIIRNQEALNNWKREIHADYGAFNFLLASDEYGGLFKSRYVLMNSYVYMVFFFGLLSMLEVFYQTTGQSIDVYTHPPAAIRRAVFCHIEATGRAMSQRDFMFKQFGAGTFANILLEEIVSKSVASL